jgi:hypothetical protein
VTGHFAAGQCQIEKFHVIRYLFFNAAAPFDAISRMISWESPIYFQEPGPLAL